MDFDHFGLVSVKNSGRIFILYFLEAPLVPSTLHNFYFDKSEIFEKDFKLSVIIFYWKALSVCYMNKLGLKKLLCK